MSKTKLDSRLQTELEMTMNQDLNSIHDMFESYDTEMPDLLDDFTDEQWLDVDFCHDDDEMPPEWIRQEFEETMLENDE